MCTASRHCGCQILPQHLLQEFQLSKIDTHIDASVWTLRESKTFTRVMRHFGLPVLELQRLVMTIAKAAGLVERAELFADDWEDQACAVHTCDEARVHFHLRERGMSIVAIAVRNNRLTHTPATALPPARCWKACTASSTSLFSIDNLSPFNHHVITLTPKVDRSFAYL